MTFTKNNPEKIYQPPAGAYCAPAGSIGFSQWQTVPLPNDGQSANGLILIGIGEFGRNALREFYSLGCQYRTGYNWNMIRCILLNDHPEEEIFPCEAFNLSNSMNGGRDILMRYISQCGQDFLNCSNLNCAIIADLLEPDLTKIMELILTHLPGNIHLKNGFFRVNLQDNTSGGYRPALLNDHQAAYLRECVHWQYSGYHDPYSRQRINYFDDIYLFRSNERDDQAAREVGLGLYTHYHSSLQNNPQLNSPARIHGVRARGIGIPWMNLIEYFSTKTAAQFLCGDQGFFNTSRITQVNIDSVLSQLNPTCEYLLKGNSQNLVDTLSSLLNNQNDPNRWVKSFALLGMLNHKKPNDPYLGASFNLVNDFAVKYVPEISKCLEAKKRSALDALRDNLKDGVIRWNVSEPRIEEEVEHFINRIWNQGATENLIQEIQPRMGVHVEASAKSIQLLPVCVSARWNGSFNIHDHVFPFPEMIDSLVGQVIVLINEKILTWYNTIPDLQMYPLAPTDCQFLREANQFVEDNPAINNFLIRKNKGQVKTPNEIFGAGRRSQALEFSEQNLTIAFSHEENLNVLGFSGVQTYQSIPGNHHDMHVKNAAHFESNNDTPAIFSNEIVMTCWDDRAVILFWKAFDREIIHWVDDSGWTLSGVPDYDDLHLMNTSQGLGSVKPVMNLMSLWQAFEMFTIDLPADIEPGAYHLPLHRDNRKKYFSALESYIRTKPINRSLVEWLKSQKKALGDGKKSHDNQHVLSDMYYLYLSARNESI